MFSTEAILSITSCCEQADMRKISQSALSFYCGACRNLGVLHNTQGGIVYG